MEPHKILIADDEANIRLLVKNTIEDGNRYHTHESGRRQGTLEHLHTRASDVFIHD